MNKRRVHYVWKRFRVIKAWYFLLAALFCGVTCIFALRANSQHMASLRQAVYTADKDNGDVQGALNNLQAYVTTHMNTNLEAGNTGVYPPIQLQYTYQRLIESQGSSNQSANQDLYTQAQAYCQKLNSKDFSGRNRVPCIEQYVEEHGKKMGIDTSSISPSLYQFNFASPSWSPDLAGWSLVATVIFVLLFVVKLLLDWWLGRALR